MKSDQGHSTVYTLCAGTIISALCLTKGMRCEIKAKTTNKIYLECRNTSEGRNDV